VSGFASLIVIDFENQYNVTVSCYFGKV
jgi:hypothetical protein